MGFPFLLLLLLKFFIIIIAIQNFMKLLFNDFTKSH